ncbi:PQQ-dependent sugar dehydrogenase [Cobetia crustatorum]|uniref:PQQ-dependent sugar dehydrogenase n=1 Tax=Cobetia crustatorum TaxID=553385 RepID=UPI00046843B8|nr:hypothetical protein [Cobetia crustatorum]
MPIDIRKPNNFGSLTNPLPSGPLTSALLLSALLINALLITTSALADASSPTSSLTLHTAVDAPEGSPSLKLPAGARLSHLAALDGPRMLHITAQGELLIGSNAGRVYRGQLADDGSLSSLETLVRLSSYPHSVVVRDSTLYVATTNALLAADYAPQRTLSAQDFRHVIEIPGGGGHNSRTLSTGPDGALYLALGIQGNCSDQYLAGTAPHYPFSERRGGVMRLDEHSKDQPRWQPWASGLRNPVGLAWQTLPRGETRLLATNNGPDHWGYEHPHELLVAATQQSFHGMPWYQWKDGKPQRDACIESVSPQPLQEISRPLAEMPARSAPMGIAVVPEGHPLSPNMDVVIAIHGSWGTAPDGKAWGDPASRRAPRLLGVKLASGNEQTQEQDQEQQHSALTPLLTGLQDSTDGARWIRPLDVAFGPNGDLYMTSDTGASGLYRITFPSPHSAN